MLKFKEIKVVFREIPEKIWSVYIHIFPNNKVYVGITSKKPEERWGYLGHNYYRGHHILLANAIKKYNWDSIKHIVLCKTTKEKAILLEKTLIKYYKSKNLSYNITDGGEGTSGFSKTPWNLGIPCSESTKLKISEANKGRESFWKNKKMSEETRLKISETRKARKIKGNITNAIRTSIYKNDVLIKTFNTGTEVSKYFNVSPAHINKCIKNNILFRGYLIKQEC